LSLVIDGTTEFQRDHFIADLGTRYQLQYYVSGRASIKRLIEVKNKNRTSGFITGNIATSTLSENIDDVDFQSAPFKRVLLVEKETSVHEALIRLFKKQENSLTICLEIQEAITKLKKEKFDHLWVSRTLVGDELEFETIVSRQNPACQIRYYDNLAQELFEESVTYKKFRDFYNRLVLIHLQTLPVDIREKCLGFAGVAVKIGQAITENLRVLDEIYYSACFYRLDISLGQQTKSVEIFDGVCRLRPIFDALQERYDGRGTMGLKDKQIPLATRIIQTLMPITQEVGKKLTVEEFEKAKAVCDKFSGKQLDPEVVSVLYHVMAPQVTKSQKKTRVAIVDSDPEYSKRLQAQLKTLSAEATIYADGMSAFAEMKKNKPDLIVSEILVSKLDGLSLCTRLRADEKMKGIPIVFLSDSVSPEHSTKALQLGAEDYISKSSDAQFILTKLERVLKRAG
jgi:DNA-binding response OmpR family regulator